eukprot:1608638-Amphidinium_carterae.2
MQLERIRDNLCGVECSSADEGVLVLVLLAAIHAHVLLTRTPFGCLRSEDRNVRDCQRLSVGFPVKVLFGILDSSESLNGAP